MSDELHVVSLVTLLDAVHTDGVAVCCVTGVTPVGTQIVFVSTSPTRQRDEGIPGPFIASINISYL